MAPRRSGSRRPRGKATAETGAITAELALGVLALFMVMSFMLGGMQLASKQVALQEAAAVAARQYARSENPRPQIQKIVGQVRSSRSHRQGWQCVTLESSGSGLLAGIKVSAQSCALDKGR